MTPEQVENRPRLAQGLYESWFVKANEPGGQRALWLRFTCLTPTHRPQEAVAETWAILFDRSTGRQRAAKQTWAQATARISGDPFRVAIGDAQLETGHTAGSIASGNGPVRWDLGFTTTSRLHRPYPLDAMYTGPLPKHKIVTPYPDELFDGWISVGDERIDVRGWPGMQGHNWGTEHTFLYVWCHCNMLGARGTWFEGMSGRVKLGPVVAPWLGVATLSIDGRRIHFRGPQALLGVRSRLARTTRTPASGAAPGWGWRFAFRQGDSSLEGEVSADREELVGLTYEGPAGPPAYCLNSKTARLALTLRERGGAPVRLESDAAALEIGTRRTDHGIRVVL